MGYSKETQGVLVKYPMHDGGALEMFVGEAKMAKFFDLCGVKWKYNRQTVPVGANIRYTPDFYLPDLDLYVEVKNRDPNSLPYMDYEKMRRFHESGKNLYVVRKPVCQPNFIMEDFQMSHRVFYSTIYLQGVDCIEPKPLVFQKGGEFGIHLAAFTDYSGFTLIDEINEANNTQFERCDHMKWEAPKRAYVKGMF